MKASKVNRKGIILAGGQGTRLHPITATVSKQLLPVYDKPMIFYGLSTLILAGIRDILIIGTEANIDDYKIHFDDGKNLGIKLTYAVQKAPNGIPEAFIIGKEFIGDAPVALMLGDNIIHGNGLSTILQTANSYLGATVFGVKVNNPDSFGVAQMDSSGKLLRVVEKPKDRIGNLAIIGLYFFPNKVIDYAINLKKSHRGEFEIVDVINQIILENEPSIRLEKLGRGFSWFDAGTPRSLLDAATYISVIQDRQNTLIGSPEESTVLMGNLKKTTMIKFCKEASTIPYFNKVALALEDMNHEED